MTTNSTLGYALLGLLHQQPMSGYDLRKIFTTTAMGSFSDSPGAIYPALNRLEARRLVHGVVAKSASLRKRRVFNITPEGISALKAWLKGPVTQEDIVRNLDDLMLRFAFMDQALGANESVRFLRQFAERVEQYLPGLQRFLDATGKAIPASARLALEFGIRDYATRLAWAHSSIAFYEQRKRDRK